MFMAEELAAGLVVDGAILAPLGATRLCLVASGRGITRQSNLVHLPCQTPYHLDQSSNTRHQLLTFVSSYSQFLRTKEIFNLLLHYLRVTPRSKRIGVLLHPLGKCTLQESCWIRIAKTM